MMLDTIKMCEYYLNNYQGKTSKVYYERLKKHTMKALLKLQLKEFDRS